MKKQSSITPYLLLALLAAYFGNRLVYEYLGQSTTGMSALLSALNGVLVSIQERPLFFSLEKACLLGALGGIAVAALAYCYFVLATPARRPGEEHGSASWGTLKDAQKYRSKGDGKLDIIMSQNVRMTLHTSDLPFDYRKNCNQVVIGGSGSGKTFKYVIPNLMQMHSSFVITDPKGTLLPEVGEMLLENGYRVAVFNTVNFQKSMRYNPLAYVRNESDILKVITVLMENTTGKGERSGEKFWIDSEKLFYQACIGWMLYSVDPIDRNLGNLLQMIRACEVREDDPDFQNAVDVMFAELEADESKGGPNNFAVTQYKLFKLSAGKTAKSILISCAARLSPFAIPEVTQLTSEDELELGRIGDELTALFIIVSDTDNTYDFLVAMLISQMFNLLCQHADDDCRGKLPIHVRCLLDEFANCIGKLPNFERLISTIRSREISVSLLVQSLAQIQSLYKDDADTIIDCCDTMIFLGGKSQKTTKAISEIMGKQTIMGRNTTESKGQNGSYSLQDQGTGRDLLDPAEVAKLPMAKELILMTGEKPFLDDKYDTPKHPNYSQLASVSGTSFDLEGHLEKTRTAAVWRKDSKILAHEVYDLGELNDL